MPTSLVGTLTSARLAGLREWQGQKYPPRNGRQSLTWTPNERLVKLFGDPARRVHAVCRPAHLLSGIARCPKCGQGLHYRNFGTPRRGKGRRAESYACVKGAAGCRGVAIKAEPLEECVTGPVLDALESPRVFDVGPPDGRAVIGAHHGGGCWSSLAGGVAWPHPLR